MLKIHETDTHYRIESDYCLKDSYYGVVSIRSCNTVWIHKDEKVFDHICLCGCNLSEIPGNWHNGGIDCYDCHSYVDCDWDYEIFYKIKHLTDEKLIKALKKYFNNKGMQFLKESEIV